jgi:hypothetical protein
MPKLYVYFGLMVFFYSNEHEPVHVHGFCQGRECKAELAVRNGKVARITFARVSRMPPLRPRELTNFKKLVRAKADEIVQKWIDYFVLRRNITPVTITRRLP